MSPLFLLFSSVLTACLEKKETTEETGTDDTSTDTATDTAEDTGDCEWGDCYGECMEPWQQQYTWEVSLEDFNNYLDEAGRLTTEQCFQICTDYFAQNEGWGEILEVLACDDQGRDGDGNEIIVCDQMMEPYCEGRRHAFVDCENRSRNTIEEWFVQATQAEMASVGAFLLLRAELRSHNAPEELLQRCLLAAKEEVEHAHLLGQVCQEMGWEIPAPQIGSLEEQSQRSLFALAVENMVEGCVNESYSALQAFHQGMVLENPKLRDIFRQIAKDETEHAQLARDIHSWLETKLTEEEKSKVQEARIKAEKDLLSYHLQAEKNPVLEKLGLPNPHAAGKLAEELGKLTA